jgi:predicted ATPase/class 3 adenylate cyclase
MRQPLGIVTFMFSDVENSTELWDRDEEAMSVSLALHDRILKEQFARHQGYVFATGGDGFGVAFASATKAVGCALAIQSSLADTEWPVPGHELRVRIGLDLGEAQPRDGDYFGPPVNRCARIMAAGHGGQVLASEAVTSVADEDAAPLGVHRLRGFGSPTSLWQIGPGDFGRLRTERTEGNLPTPLTGFVGRSEELADLVAMVQRHRLTTLTGVGGIGKTRLAIELCHVIRDGFPDGVFLCDLAPIGDPGALADFVVSILPMSSAPNASPTETILDWLGQRRAILLFDNCEHLIEATAELVEEILARTESIVIATSREALRLPGEHIWPVQPFDEAVSLFIERASAARPDFVATGNEETVESICDQLDRIPLAIELAAARCRTMSVSEILERLSDRFQLLRGAGRGGTERHQTMQTAVRWSYELLSDDERELFDRLCVFPAAFDAAAVSAVCAPDEPGEWKTLDVLDALVNQSMVEVRPTEGLSRYRLLETFRQYGETQIEPSLLRDLRDRHLRHYLDITGAASADFLRSATHEAAIARFVDAWPDIRVAMQWAVTTGDGDSCGELMENVFWYAGLGSIHEMNEWADEAMAIQPRSNVTLIAASWGASLRGEVERAIEIADEAVRVGPDDPRALVMLLGAVTRREGMAEPEFVGMARRIPALARSQPDDVTRVLVLAATANMLAVGDPTLSEELAEEVEALLGSDLGSRIEAQVRAWLARRAQLRQDGEEARSQCRRVHQLIQSASTPIWAGQIAYQVEADVALTGNQPDAPLVATAALEALATSGNWFDTWAVLEPIAVWMHECGDTGPAATIAGFFDEHGIGCRDPGRAAVLATLAGDPGQQMHAEQGRSVTKTELVDRTLAYLEHRATASARPQSHGGRG